MLASIGGYSGGGGYDGGSGGTTTTIAVGGTGLLFLPPLLMIVFRQKYPRWWFDWSRELLRVTKPGGELRGVDERPLAVVPSEVVHPGLLGG